MKVLLVDHDESVRELTQLFLHRSNDMSVHCVSKGSEALEMLGSEHFDVVVSDFILPDMDGLELLRLLRESMNIPFIVFTDLNRDEVVIESFANGADFYIQKGGDPVVQFKCLDNAIRMAGAARETAYKIAEAELIRRQMFNIIPEPLMLLRDGHIYDCNKSTIQMTGYTRDQLLGQNPASMLGYEGSSSIIANSLSEPGPATPLLIQDRKGRPRRFELHVMDLDVPGTNMQAASFRMMDALSDDEVHPHLDTLWSICQVMGMNMTVLDQQGKLIRSTRPCTDGIPMALDASISIDTLDDISMVRMVDGQEGLALRARSTMGMVWAVLETKNGLTHNNGSNGGSVLPVPADVNGVENLLDGLEDGVIRLMGGSIIWINRTAESLLRIDRSSEMMIHLDGTSLDDAWGNPMTIDDIIGCACNGDGGLYELRYEGGTKWLYAYMVGTCDDGAMIISDRTATVIAEQRAYLGENLLDFATRGMELIIFEYDLQSGKVAHDPLLPNKLGYSREEFARILEREGLMGLVTLLVPPNELPEFMSKMEGFMSSREENIDLILPLIHKRGHHQWWRAIIKVTARDDDEIPIRLRGLAIDTTRMKQYQNALESVNRKMNLLDSITRHDILNKMTILTGYMVLMRQSLDDVSLSREYLDRMNENARMIQKHLEFTREYRTMGMNAPRWQDLQYVIMAAWDPKSTLGLHISPDAVKYQIFADLMVIKVFENLFSNVSIHSGGAERVRVDLERSPSTLIIKVIDDGQGVPDRNKERIFSRGYGRNTGFGLFLAREIMGITGATISEIGIEGDGAVFELTIPATAFREMEWN